MTSLPPLTTPRFRPLDRILSLGGGRFLFWLAFVCVLLEGTLFVDPHAVTTHYDEHYFFAQDDISRETMMRFRELPAWNPYFCGGIPAAANPQSEAFAPDFLLRILYGTGPGRRLAALLFVLLGLEGTFRLARRYGSSPIGSVVAAIAFAASGRFYFMYQFGWINMFGFMLLPWAILGYEIGRTKRGWGGALLGGAALAWMALAGGTYTLPFSVLVLVALMVWDTLAALAFREAGRIRDPFLTIAQVGIVSALLSAAKLVPMFAVVFEHPRTWNEPSVVGPIGVIESLIMRNGGAYAGESWVGGLFIIAAVIPLFLRDAKVLRPLAVGALFFALAMGNMGPKHDVSIYGALHTLPVFSQLRSPERFTIIVCLFMALAIGRLVVHVEEGPLTIARLFHVRFLELKRGVWDPGRVARFVTGLLGGLSAIGLGLAITLTLLLYNHVSRETFVQDAPVFADAPFKQSRGNRWDAHVWPRVSMGTLLCFDENPYPQSPALRGDLTHEEFAEDAALADVKRVGWTPNSISLAVDAKAETRVLVNQNYHRGWQANVGRVESKDGLLSVVVPAGHHDVVLRHRSTLLYVGIAVNVLAVLGIAAIALALAVRRRRQGATARQR